MKIHQSTPSIPTGLEALKSDLQKDITHLQEEGAAIDKRHENLIKRHQSISENNGGADTKPSDMITLNVSGTEMFARRDTLTAVKGSRLDALFSGRWENRLLRDEKGRVFMDADPSVFGKIVKYLKMVKLSASHSRQGDVRAKPLRNPTMSGSYEKKMFDLYLEIFHLQDQATAVSDTVQEVNTNNYENALTAKMKKMRAELDEAEKRIHQEESFVSCFVTKDSHDHQEGYSSDDLSQWSVDSNDSSDITIDGTTSPASKRTTNRMALDDEALGILNLCIDGQMMAVKRSTLCLDPESKLAQDFSNNDWLYDHKVASENGKTMFVVDHSAGAFKAIGSNPNINDKNHTCARVRRFYELPNGVTDPYFLTGSKHFKVSEYEVFHV